MSKIEKALGRARSSGQLQVVSGGKRPSGDTLPVPQRLAGRSPRDLEHRALSAQAIARMREPAPRSKLDLAQNRVIYPELAENDTVKAMREIRTKVVQKTQGRNCVLMISSVAPGGGGSFVAFNLGVAFAFDAGQTALLVDCNLRDPSLPRLFSDTPQLGLTDFLEDPALEVADIIHPIGIERLRVIPAGEKRETPAEYFTSIRMRQMLEGVLNRYPERYIILDAPPMTEAADASTLAQLSDLVLLVVPYGRVTTPQIAEMVKEIPPEKLLGLVFNDEPGLPAWSWREMLKGAFTDALRRLNPFGRKADPAI